jgi:hypothetical protein
MGQIKQWWNNDLSKWVKFVYLVLLANGVPAFIILMTLPGKTETLFVWTIKPVINARLIGVMYFNALLLVAFGIFQTSWARARITMVVITLFSILATILTFFFLKPFLAHPWYHLTYWLIMYLVLFFAAPIVFVTQERKHGGRLPVQAPLTTLGRLAAVASMILSLVCGLGLIFAVDTVNRFWPWVLPPLVGGLIGVLFITHAAAYAWALWDGDWLRVRPIFWQAPITALLFILLTVFHLKELRSEALGSLILYLAVAGFVSLSNLIAIVDNRAAEKNGAIDVA